MTTTAQPESYRASKCNGVYRRELCAAYHNIKLRKGDDELVMRAMRAVKMAIRYSSRCTG